MPAEVRGMLIDTETDTGGRNDSIGNTLEFQYTPNKVRRRVEIRWPGQFLPGWSHDRMQWGGGGRRSQNIELMFDQATDDPDWVAKRVDWLESLTLGRYDETGAEVGVPPTCLFIYGRWINRRVKVTGFDAVFGELFHPETLHPLEAVVTLELTDFVTRAVDRMELRR